MRVNRVKRYICAEVLHWIISYKCSHELYRLTHIHKEGLTPKELAYIERCREDLDDVWKRMSKMQHRLRQSA